MQHTSLEPSHVKILYVTDSRHGHRAWFDPSARHRVYHYADGLAADGYRVRVVHIENITSSVAHNFDHIIFHRPKFTQRFKTAFEICKQTRAVLHADYDDLIFNADFAEFSPMYLNGNRPLQKVKEYFQHNYQAAEKFDHFLVSTRYLSTQLKKCFPEAHITTLPNSLPRGFSAPEQKPTSADNFTIGYFPGSNSHGHDLNMIGDVLAEFLDQSTQCRLVIAGQFNREDINNKRLEVEQLPYMDYRKYLALLARVDVSIAPLEDNPFNLAKSAVKLIESVSVGTPILVSDNPDMVDHQNSLSTIVKDTSYWSEALNRVKEKSVVSGKPKDKALAGRYLVTDRLPVIEDHLKCAV